MTSRDYHINNPTIAREARSEGKLHDPTIHLSSGTMDGRLRAGHDKQGFRRPLTGLMLKSYTRFSALVLLGR
jgi:hypothetical protein